MMNEERLSLRCRLIWWQRVQCKLCSLGRKADCLMAVCVDAMSCREMKNSPARYDVWKQPITVPHRLWLWDR